jgi:hypothetical protein
MFVVINSITKAVNFVDNDQLIAYLSVYWFHSYPNGSEYLGSYPIKSTVFIKKQLKNGESDSHVIGVIKSYKLDNNLFVYNINDCDSVILFGDLSKLLDRIMTFPDILSGCQYLDDYGDDVYVQFDKYLTCGNMEFHLTDCRHH